MDAARTCSRILSDGRDHGFPNGYESFVPRIGKAMKALRDKGIVTSNDPYVAMQQASNWLMANAGDGVFSFGGGGPSGRDDAEYLSRTSGVSREHINSVKFMFDSIHEAELTQQDNTQVTKDNPIFNELATILTNTGNFS